ncbi:hypothetical protein OG552_04275 [Streptomyces sp. NBC_01476]|uniref:hypothetical protein n=1 Tax=Streptomyces sp. NBC_01476 TaxID=2903881 RepID=UPI002E3455D7|nr:hypothetical protein [Streptomyces sp. NBC_01476]
MTDDNPEHLVRDLPPLVAAPELPGEGGPRREKPPAEHQANARPAPRKTDPAAADRRR